MYVYMECGIGLHVPVYCVKAYSKVVYVIAIVVVTGQLVSCSYVV